MGRREQFTMSTLSDHNPQDSKSLNILQNKSRSKNIRVVIFLSLSVDKSNAILFINSLFMLIALKSI